MHSSGRRMEKKGENWNYFMEKWNLSTTMTATASIKYGPTLDYTRTRSHFFILVLFIAHSSIQTNKHAHNAAEQMRMVCMCRLGNKYRRSDDKIFVSIRLNFDAICLNINGIEFDQRNAYRPASLSRFFIFYLACLEL